MKLGFGGRIQNSKDLKFRRASKVGKLRRQNVIELSFKKCFQSKSEVKLRFKGRIRNTKDLELLKTSKVGKLRR
jgi:hypothetical protein